MLRQARRGAAGSKVKQSGQGRGFGGGQKRAGSNARSKTDEARDLLANVIVCHIPCPRYDFQEKVRQPHLNKLMCGYASMLKIHFKGRLHM